MTRDLPPCPVETTLLLVGNKWKLLIVRDLLSGTKRFNELKTSMNVAQKVLTENLRSMEEDGLLIRTAYPEIPPKVEYELTDLGRSLSPIMDVLASWGYSYKESFGANRC